MKKLLLLTIAALMSVMSFAQEVSDNVIKIFTSDGITTPILSRSFVLYFWVYCSTQI